VEDGCSISSGIAGTVGKDSFLTRPVVEVAVSINTRSLLGTLL